MLVIQGEQLPITGLIVIYLLMLFNVVDKVICAAQHQAASIRTGIISELRKGFQNIGRKGIYDPLTLQGSYFCTSGSVIAICLISEKSKVFLGLSLIRQKLYQELNGFVHAQYAFGYPGKVWISNLPGTKP